MPGLARTRWMAPIAVLLLASCARHAPAPAPIAAAPEAAPPRPLLAAQFEAVAAPLQAPDGGYQTINHDVDSLQAMWHVRAALNVAAIGCRGPEGTALVQAYNAMLIAEKPALAKANLSVQASYRSRFGAKWQDAHDQYMTRLYNFFAQPFAKAAFCQTAATVASEATTTAPQDFAGWAQAALPRLEAPFLDGYRQIDAYRVASAAWDARYGPNATPTMLAAAPIVTATPVAVAVVAPRPTTAGPQLRYADMTMLLAWQPSPGTVLASR